MNGVRAFLLTSLIGLVALVVGSCGSAQQSIFVPDASSDGGADAAVYYPPLGPACVGLQCQQVQCEAGTTTVSGTVFDPAGKVPLYNAIVYVPNSPLAPLSTGASCDRCGYVSGDPLVSTLTGPDGRFELQNVPAGAGIPLVVQIGKWRRQLSIPTVAACTETALPAGDVRLPRNQSEGDLPQMAIATGGADPMECLLTKMGIDTSEFTPDTGNGRVRFYKENGYDMNPPVPAANTLFDDGAKLAENDIVFLPCEGSPDPKTPTQTQNLITYTDMGGRVFTTHYGYVWIYGAQDPFPSTGQWDPEQSDQYSLTLPTTINQTFPKGAAFARWLVNVNASTTLGQLGITEGRHDLDGANDPPSTAWITTTGEPAPHTNGVLHMTFNTPIEAPEDQKCGRVVYSDFHVSASALSGLPLFPDSCKTGDLSDQEKALEFMLFDLSSCVQSDSVPPEAPH